MGPPKEVPVFTKPLCRCAPDADWFEYDSDAEFSREGSEDDEDY
jgi:hypothetical protein